MIKQAISEAGLDSLAVMGVLTFVAIFTAIVAWTLSRSRKQVNAWSSLPLADGTDPVEPREPYRDALQVVSKSGDSCGKCTDCTCQ